MLTVPHSRERIALIAESKSHGSLFLATGGAHITGDDFFKAAASNKRKEEISKMEVEKKKRLLFEKWSVEGLAVLDQKKAVNDLIGSELEKLLLMYHIPKAKHGNKGEKKKKWEEIKQRNEPPPAFQPWGPDDEAELCNLCKMDIKMEDTALERMRLIEKLKTKGSINNMEICELNELEEKIKEVKRLKTEKKEVNEGGSQSEGGTDLEQAEV
mmetsp:Transcript_448/g.897  ORF Transcript_448/g.897 Transcript_448/m.897 type:complete len:213 (+) Transcript_448:207-845(+)